MARISRIANRRGGILLVLAVIAVFVLGLLGIAGSAGAGSFTGVAEMVAGDRAAASYARLALDEAQEVLEHDARNAVEPWYSALRQPRVEGKSFTPLEDVVPLKRTPRLAAEEDHSGAEITVTATLFQQNPFGVRAQDRVWGGDQTYGTIALKATVRLEAPHAGIFSKGRSCESQRLIGYRATLPELAAPFDQSPLWVSDPDFLRTQATAIQQQVLKLCPGVTPQSLPKPEDLVKGLLYARLGLSVATSAELSFSSQAGDCAGAATGLQNYWNGFTKDFRFLQDSNAKRTMRELYWPQMSEDAFANAQLGRAERIFPGQTELNAFLGAAPGEPVDLSGTYYVAGALDLNWTYTGRGCIVSPKTVRVTGARKVKADDTLTIVSTLGSIDLSGASDTVQAALFATTGTVIGLSGKHIHGVLAAAHLASGFESGSDTRIDLDKELTRHQPGAMEAGPDSLQVHFDDVPLAQF